MSFRPYQFDFVPPATLPPVPPAPVAASPIVSGPTAPASTRAAQAISRIASIQQTVDYLSNAILSRTGNRSIPLGANRDFLVQAAAGRLLSTTSIPTEITVSLYNSVVQSEVAAGVADSILAQSESGVIADPRQRADLTAVSAAFENYVIEKGSPDDWAPLALRHLAGDRSIMTRISSVLNDIPILKHDPPSSFAGLLTQAAEACIPDLLSLLDLHPGIAGALSKFLDGLEAAYNDLFLILAIPDQVAQAVDLLATVFMGGLSSILGEAAGAAGTAAGGLAQAIPGIGPCLRSAVGVSISAMVDSSLRPLMQKVQRGAAGIIYPRLLPDAFEAAVNSTLLDTHLGTAFTQVIKGMSMASNLSETNAINGLRFNAALSSLRPRPLTTSAPSSSPLAKGEFALGLLSMAASERQRQSDRLIEAVTKMMNLRSGNTASAVSLVRAHSSAASLKTISSGGTPPPRSSAASSSTTVLVGDGGTSFPLPGDLDPPPPSLIDSLQKQGLAV